MQKRAFDYLRQLESAVVVEVPHQTSVCTDVDVLPNQPSSSFGNYTYINHLLPFINCTYFFVDFKNGIFHI